MMMMMMMIETRNDTRRQRNEEKRGGKKKKETIRTRDRELREDEEYKERWDAGEEKKHK